MTFYFKITTNKKFKEYYSGHLKECNDKQLY